MLREDRGRLTEEISVDLIDVHGEDLSPAAENADDVTSGGSGDGHGSWKAKRVIY